MADLLMFDGTSFSAVTCDELDDYYAALNCDTFDIATRKIGDKYFDIFCDDVGLFREWPLVTAVSPSNHPMLVGNLIFANHDNEGNTTSLSQDDVDMIRNAERVLLNLITGALQHVIVCDY